MSPWLWLLDLRRTGGVHFNRYPEALIRKKAMHRRLCHDLLVPGSYLSGEKLATASKRKLAPFVTPKPQFVSARSTPLGEDNFVADPQGPSTTET